MPAGAKVEDSISFDSIGLLPKADKETPDFRQSLLLKAEDDIGIVKFESEVKNKLEVKEPETIIAEPRFETKVLG